MPSTNETSAWSVIAGPDPNFWTDLVPDPYDHLRITEDDVDWDWLIAAIEAAADYAEESMGIILAARTIRATFYHGAALVLPRGPVQSITSITDANGATATDYQIENAGHTATVKLTGGDGLTYPINVVYLAGYTADQDVPMSIRMAIVAHVGTLYIARESTSDRTRTVVPHSLEDFYRLKSRRPLIG